ncbi:MULTISPECIES: GNAT family N-acetyltransferase [unclassified Plantibacter]|jgi:predicted GNAT family acetyltransferase|uniref:GNAT family N-acetyltransferase n=1 Tax=unclassified Plantibacter TaxID=2624265 RepID=UPI003D344195
MAEPTAAPRVTRNETTHEYEIWVGDVRAGISGYKLRPGQVVFTHTEIDPDFGGQGLGSILVEGSLEDVVSRGEKIVPYCPFVQAYLRKHPAFEAHVEWPAERPAEPDEDGASA